MKLKELKEIIVQSYEKFGDIRVVIDTEPVSFGTELVDIEDIEAEGFNVGKGMHLTIKPCSPYPGEE